MRRVFLGAGIFLAGLGTALGVVYMSRPEPAPVAATLQRVSLKNGKAEPSALIVKTGQSVQFDTRDDQLHDIGEGTGKASDEHGDQAHGEAAHEPGGHDHPKDGLQSGVFGKGQSFRLQFKKPGVYRLHDHLHPEIAVTVIAYDETGAVR